jgi:hypothetical protein
MRHTLPRAAAGRNVFPSIDRGFLCVRGEILVSARAWVLRPGSDEQTAGRSRFGCLAPLDDRRYAPPKVSQSAFSRSGDGEFVSRASRRAPDGLAWRMSVRNKADAPGSDSCIERVWCHVRCELGP